MAILEVKNLKKRFTDKKRDFIAVKDVSFSIGEGECFGLVGESGCGKSTTANMVARLLKETSGEIAFLGTKLSDSKYLKCAGQDMQMVFQNPKDSFDARYTVKKCIMQGAKSYKIYNNQELVQKAKELLLYVGLKESYLDRKIGELSGGECQRVAIARALICNPKLIIFDEATSALDVSMQAQIVELIQKMQKELKASFLFITHDLGLAATICDKIAVMYAGYIVETGDAKEILASPYHPYTQLLLSCVLPAHVDDTYQIPDFSAVNAGHLEECCPFYEFCSYSIDACAKQCPKEREIDGRKVRCHMIKP